MESIAPWRMTDDGEFELNEPYRTEVARIRIEATRSFNDTLYAELSKLTSYSVAELREAYVRRCCEREQEASDNVTSFIVEALTGELFA